MQKQKNSNHASDIPRQPQHFWNNIQNEVYQALHRIILDRMTFHTADALKKILSSCC